MKILLTFIGNNDCYPFERSGPILTIFQNTQFDKVYLLYNDEKYLRYASDILRYCNKFFPDIQFVYQKALSQNPTDYNTVYPAMYNALAEIKKENPNARFTISLSSGTPTMHTCWIFLQQGGVIDAKIIQVSKEAGISEVNFDLDDFPKIQHVDELKVELTKLTRENRNLKHQLQLKFDNMIGECFEIQKVKEQIALFADTELPVFTHGESGTGKELVAEAIHYNSSRKEKPLTKINCGAIPGNLFESEFFGHKKGAFTGANSDKIGKFKQSDGGTVFLDEIAELPLDMQVKLLRVIEYGTFVPLGATAEEKVDVRIISATNKDIRILVREGAFREDLFYRLVHVEINLPPLDQRGNDKLLIAHHILDGLNRKYDKRKTMDRSADELILSHRWPGNIRQLKNTLETAFILAGNKIEAKHFNIIEVTTTQKSISIPDAGLDLENEVIPSYYEAALKKTNGNAEQAAKLLRLQPHTFRARLRAMKGKNFYGGK